MVIPNPYRLGNYDCMIQCILMEINTFLYNFTKSIVAFVITCKSIMLDHQKIAFEYTVPEH